MSGKPDEFFPLFFGPYLRDTMHLTTEQHGAYLLILMAYWIAQGPLSDDDAVLSAIAKIDQKTWRKKLRPVVEKFFIIEDGKWHQKRADSELSRAVGLSKSRSEAGKRGNDTRWQRDRKPDRKEIANGVANPSQNASQNDRILHSTKSSTLSSSALRSAREKLLPLCDALKVSPATDARLIVDWPTEIAALEAEGLDFERHILAAAKETGARGTKIKSLKYLRGRALELHAAEQPAPVQFEDTDEEGWRKRIGATVKIARENGATFDAVWPKKWGPSRGEQCKIPQHLQQLVPPA